MVLLSLHGCTSFVAADPGPGGESSSGLSDPDSAGSSGASLSGSTTVDSVGSTDPDPTTPDATDPDSGPDPATSRGSDSDPDPSGSTSDEPSSTTGGVDPSSTGGESSTGNVPLTCAELVLPEQFPAECSSGGGDDVDLQVVNDCFAVAVVVLWVNYSCEEIPFGFVEPGELWEQETFQNHPWRIRNAETGELMRDIPGLVGDTTLPVLGR